MNTSRDERHQRDPATDQLEAILERALTAYHHDELHGGARWLGERILDAHLVPVAREAFLDADDLPDDREVLRVFDDEAMQLLGEGYHVIALVEPERRFVAKYAKFLEPVPPLAQPPAAPPPEWEHDHGVRPDGSLHPAMWQHIRAFEAYGPLVVPSRVYIADSAFDALSAQESRALERFRSIGIVRSLGRAPRRLRVTYPDDFPQDKRAAEGVTASVVVVQPMVTSLSSAIEQSLRAGDVAAARDLEARYHEFTRQLWRCGISHLDFSILNIGIVGSETNERLQIFDPHIGEIDVANGARKALDPLSVRPSGERSIDNVLRSSRDGSRWALWRVQQDITASKDAPPEAADEAAALVHEFHIASEGVEEGRGSFGFERFDQTWRQRPTHVINTVMHAQLWALVRHPLGNLIRSVLDPTTPDTVYERSVAVLDTLGERPLAQFRAGLRAYGNRPLLVVANVSDASRLVKHWGHLRLPAELDIQDDPAIHYHLRDLFTGEMYVRAGDELSRPGLAIGLAPHELHVLQIEDISVEDIAVEQGLTTHRDISEFLKDCTKRVGVVGDVHGELEALKEILRALGFIDASDDWLARDGTLVLTGDVGHGRHLQAVFDFIHRLAAQAHRSGGRIVWTLGNHDLFVDREGGQGGEDSLGYRLWPKVREAALHPERHPGLSVQAAYFEHGKLFVHAGVLPNIVELVRRERGASDAETVASYVNDVLRKTFVERERIRARDLPHEIFRIGTSHTRERVMPGEIGYEPAGVFTPDLREVDHYRYHAQLLPQVVGHTASHKGRIRYSPRSWLRRDYIAIDVGRQHGSGNGGLLLTDFGWVAVNPGGPARLVEVTPLFIELAREAAGQKSYQEPGADYVWRMLSGYFQAAKPKRRTVGEAQEGLFADLAPTQVVSLERFLTAIRQEGRCVIVTDLDEMLTAFTGGPLKEDTIEVFADYLGAGGVLVFNTATTFEWFYARLLRPLIVKLGPHSQLLAGVLLILSNGLEIFAFEEGAFRLIASGASRERSGAFDTLVELSRERGLRYTPPLDSESTAYLADSRPPNRIDQAIASRVGTVIDVADVMLAATGKPLISLHRGYHRTLGVIVAATAALYETRPIAHPPSQSDVGDTALWTFEQPQVPAGRRVRVRVAGSGFVHAGVTDSRGDWTRVYNVPLVPMPDGGYEAVLPSGVNVFTFFWTEAPWTPGHPGHWERSRNGPTVFSVRGK